MSDFTMAGRRRLAALFRRLAGHKLLSVSLAVGLLIAANEATYQTLRQWGWKTYTSANSGLADNRVHDVAIDSQNRIWVTTDKGLSRFGPGNDWTTYNAGDWTGNLAIDKQGQVWVETEAGLGRLELNGFRAALVSDAYEFADSSISDLAVDQQGRIWVASSDGLSMRNLDGTWRKYRAPAGHPYLSTPVVAIDKQGRVWVGDYEKVLSVLDMNGKWITQTIKNAWLPSVTAIAFDKQSLLWLGQEYGLSSLDSNGVLTDYYPKDPGVFLVDIRGIAFDERGRVWCGTADFGLDVLQQDDTWIGYTTENSGLTYNYTSGPVFDEAGQLWIGTERGLQVFDANTALPYEIVQILPKAHLQILLIALSGLCLCLFIGFVRRVTKRSPARFKPETTPIIPAYVQTPLQRGRYLLAYGQREKAVGCFLEAFQNGSPEDRQQAAAELEKLGEVELA